MADSFDLVVIGAGPAGYVAALRAAQLGLKTAIIDKWSDDKGKPSPGGTCLNVGCIPSKALLDTSHKFEMAAHDFADMGIKVNKPQIDVSTMLKRKQGIVDKLTGGIGQLLKAKKVEFIHGTGKLLKDRQVEVTPVAKDSEKRTLRGEHVILASGSVPIEIPSARFDGKHIVDNEGALSFDDVPKRLGVIGAGVIGLELGSVWSRLGAEVTVIEAMGDFLGAVDRDIAKAAQKSFKKQGLDIKLGAKLTDAKVSRGGVNLAYEDKDGEQKLRVDKLLVAVGRRAYTDGLLSDDCGVKLTDRGQVEVDENCRTSVENVWGIGDAVRGPMLAHKASEEGVAVVERIATGHGHIDFNTVPWVIYTEPEIAWVGKTEAQLKDEGIEYRSGSFAFAVNGRAMGMNSTDGMVKMLADAKTDRILGCHMVGPNVSELISEIVVAMEFAASSEDIARIVHAHPTLSEVTHEAALAVDKRAIHSAK
jgi:dihydrolipoamide dehydrogenase